MIELSEDLERVLTAYAERHDQTVADVVRAALLAHVRTHDVQLWQQLVSNLPKGGCLLLEGTD